MSLIHQALKKLDDTRDLRPPRETHLSTGTGKAPFLVGKPIALAALFLMLAIAALAAIRLYTARPDASAAARSARAPAAVADALPAEAAKTPSVEEQPSERAPDTGEFVRDGLALYKKGRYGDAAVRFEKAAKAAPANAVYRNNLALALMRSGRPVRAEAAFKEALRLRPLYPEALNNYGALMAADGKPDRAVALFAKAAMANPAYPDPYLNAAVTLDRAGRSLEAIARYNRFLALSGDEEAKAAVRKKVASLRSRIAVEGAHGAANTLP